MEVWCVLGAELGWHRADACRASVTQPIHHSTDFAHPYLPFAVTKSFCGRAHPVVRISFRPVYPTDCRHQPAPLLASFAPRPGSGSRYPQGITLYTSMDAGNTFTRACLPVALNVRRGRVAWSWGGGRQWGREAE